MENKTLSYEKGFFITVALTFMAEVIILVLIFKYVLVEYPMPGSQINYTSEAQQDAG